jgi:tetratricopeptide (TPR) repeat protein
MAVRFDNRRLARRGWILFAAVVVLLSAWPSSSRAQGAGVGLEGLLDEYVEKTLASRDPMMLAAEGERLTPEEATRLESQLVLAPSDLEARCRLLGFYARRADASESNRRLRRGHVLWLIRNRPADAIAGSHYAALTRADLAEGLTPVREAWQQQVKQNGRNADVLRHAGDGLMRWDLEAAETIFRRGMELEPKQPVWPARLGTLYTLHAGERDGEERRTLAEKARGAFEAALALADFVDEKIALWMEAGQSAMVLGDEDTATRHAQQLVMTGNGRHGEATHAGQTMLGLMARRGGEIEEAVECLKRSAAFERRSVPLGWEPSMDLAAGLAGDGEREAVLAYLKACEAIWPAGMAKLAAWGETLGAGEMPGDWMGVEAMGANEN